MKRLVVLLSVVMLFVTGCSVNKLNSTSIDDNIQTLLSKKVNMSNVYYDGYKYYLPKGIRFVDKDDYNAILMDGHNNKYYLYVDAVGYYHKIKNSYKEKKNSYYSKKLNYNHKTGYVQINEVDSKYFIQFVFHYVKMEAYVSSEDLTDTINNMCCILRTVKFNDYILESLIGENVLNYKEEDYTLFKADSSKESFLDVVEREETERYKKDLEDEKIDLD